jgi:predicted DNA-binding transcriptional regulator YafY
MSENILKGYCYNVEMDRNFRIDRIRRAELIR